MTNSSSVSHNAVVGCADGMYVILHAWIRDSKAFWPPYSNNSQCRSTAKKMAEPCYNWEMYSVRKWAQHCK